ncbi:hypothetical protein KY386_00940 [Candidatus Parcubacteria bacterium]|nr:hypothetical protein [Candidatus Parcubacteria bacterium]
MTQVTKDSPDACSDKFSYTSQSQAIAARAYAQWQYGDRSKLQPYRCQTCTAWHLASRIDGED